MGDAEGERLVEHNNYIEMRRRRFASCLALVLGMGFCLTASADSIQISLIPSDAVVNPGDTIDIDIFATTDSTLIGFGFDLVASNELGFEGFTVGPAFVSPLTLDGDGLAGLSFSGGIDGVNVLIGTAQYTALSIGQAVIDLATTPGDLTEGFAQAGAGFFDVTSETLLLSVVGVSDSNGGGDSSVPEPATAILLATGLVTLVRSRR